MKNILAICGSLRTESTNLKIIETVARLAARHLSFSVYQGLSALSAFNADLDGEGAMPPAESVKSWWFQERRRQSGLLIKT